MTFMAYYSPSRWKNSVTVAAVVLCCAALALTLPTLVAPGSEALTTRYPTVHVAIVSFVALCVQALPFVLIGAATSATVAVWMTPQRWSRVIPSFTPAAIVVAAIAGMIVPTCECSSVPLARRMMNSGVSPAAAMTFMVSAPSLNPLVVTATVTAFVGWEMAAARFVAGLISVVGVGAMVAKWGHNAFAEHVYDSAVGHDHVGHDHAGHDHAQLPVLHRWINAVWHDAIGAATFLVIGGAIAATASAVFPASTVAYLSDNVIVAVLVMALLAIVVSLCSLGDSFVAASLVGLHPAGMLSFMVVGPIIDVKLTAMMEGILGFRPTRFIAISGVSMAILATFITAALWGWF